MEGETIALAFVFVGFILTILLMIWNVSNRICDKIGNLDTVLDSKFDAIIDKISSIATDISIIKEFSRPIQTVSFQLEHSGITGTISTRPEEFTSVALSYSIEFSEPINKGRIINAVVKLPSRKLQFIGALGTLALIKIKSVDLDENASLIKTFLQELDKELSFDRSREITESIENKLKKIL